MELEQKLRAHICSYLQGEKGKGGWRMDLEKQKEKERGRHRDKDREPNKDRQIEALATVKCLENFQFLIL